MSSYYIECATKYNNIDVEKLHSKFKSIVQSDSDGLKYLYFQSYVARYCLILTNISTTLVNVRKDLVMLTAATSVWELGWIDLPQFSNDVGWFCLPLLHRVDSILGPLPRTFTNSLTKSVWVACSAEGVVPYLYDIEGI